MDKENHNKPRPLEEWHEDMGDVLWWRFPIEEPPYVGSPLDVGFPVETISRFIAGGQAEERTDSFFVGGWPGYHTHFTPIPLPDQEG